MSGKKLIFTILALTIISIIIVWFVLQDVIVKYDIDRALDSSSFILNNIITAVYK